MGKIEYILLQNISEYYACSFNEIEYAHNKLGSIDLVLECAKYVHTHNIKLPDYAHELMDRERNKREEIKI